MARAMVPGLSDCLRQLRRVHGLGDPMTVAEPLETRCVLGCLPALSLIASRDADVLYLGPPYPGTTGYEREYGVLDDLLGDTLDAAAAPDLDELLAAAAHIPLALISFGGPTLTLPELSAGVSRHRPVLQALAVPHVHLASIARRNQNDSSEYIILAGS